MIELSTFQSGHLEKGNGYHYFIPNEVNTQWIWKDPTLNTLLEKASVKLGELNSYARFVPNVNLFIQLHVTKEAVISSKIEGTQTKIDEALLPEGEVNPERRQDWKEVNNYISALNDAISELKELPLSSRLIRKAHKTLMEGVRGEYKLPGEYRTSQNWIGGANLADAAFIPPHHQLVNPLMGDLENFIHNENIEVPELICIGIAHYQFETIHPFLDGNGRIGRLLITLFLVGKGILDQPLLYLSAYFEKNKQLYYGSLTNVRSKNDLLEWLKYFLIGIIETATQGVETLTEILELKERIETEIKSTYGRRTQSALLLLQSLLVNPITTAERAAKNCDLSYKAANGLIAAMQKSGYLKEMTGQSRNRIFSFDLYLQSFSLE